MIRLICLVCALALAACSAVMPPKFVAPVRGVPTGIDVPGHADYVLVDGRVVQIADCRAPSVWNNPKTREASCLFNSDGGEHDDQDD